MAQKCLSFDFIDDYITVPSSDSLNLGTDDITIEMWIKRNTGNLGEYQWLYKKRGAVDGKTRWFNLYFSTDNYLYSQITDNFEVNGYKQFKSQSAITDSNWHYVAAVFDRDGNGTLYVDNEAGTPVDISAVSGSVSNNAAVLIGAYSTTIRSFDGLIDEVRISNIARGSDEISAIWNGGDGVQFEVDANTVALWHMNEGSAGTIYDETNNDNDGTIHGASWTDGYDFLTSHPTSSDAGSGLDVSTLSEVFFSADSGVGLGALAALLAVINTSEVSSGSDRLRAKIESATAGGDVKLPPGGQASIPSRKVGI